MEPIQTALNRWMEENSDFKSRHEAMKSMILSHPDINRFLNDHPEITATEMDKRLNRLYEYMTQSIRCSDCQSYATCQNMLKGYSPILEVVRGEIRVSYEKCPNQLQYDKQSEKQKLMKSLYIPREILQAQFENLTINPERREALNAANDFLNKAEAALPERGIFFTGPFGVGKTYFLGAIANRLKSFGLSSMIIYMPEFVREMRDAIRDNNVQEKIDAFKNADVLMLDDIGAETFSAWFRDEVLGSILQYRMMERLPMFFTSNYTMDQLEDILSSSTKGQVEKVKARRIMERIRQVSTEIILKGENMRT